MKKVILDVDPGIDDAMALALAFKSEKLDILGVTTVAGNLSLDKTTKNAAKILDILNAKCKVYAGAAMPLKKKVHTAEHIHGPTGLGFFSWSETEENISSQDAISFMAEQINKYPNEVTIIAVAPLTNIAKLLNKYPNIESKIAEIIIMGGAVNVKGNVSEEAEFNIYADPEAAGAVFSSSCNKKLVGLDVTLKVLLTAENLEEIKGYNNKIADAVVEMTRFYLGKYRDVNKLSGCALHDPLAVGVAITEEIVKTTPMYLEVVEEEGVKRGKIVQSDTGHPVDVCLKVDAKEFLNFYMDTLK
ncbi:nucleoside hydrolase [Proteinivorax hydrogeniformans]|uniref:Nucleoside hydrolase n=1 Tax=Proteinivorax hydrogeniformans TaxID=1826727 RepID=A0AAU8HTV7_9FIRM